MCFLLLSVIYFPRDDISLSLANSSGAVLASMCAKTGVHEVRLVLMLYLCRYAYEDRIVYKI